MRDLLIGLLAWLTAETGYAAPSTLPEIRLLSQSQIQSIALPHGPWIPLTAFYDDDVIYIDVRWDPATTRGHALLVHELTHWLQHKNGKRGPMCAWEQEAYAMADRWYRANGAEPPPIAIERILQTACHWSLGPT
ncbi:MAG: hypothetical protein ACREGL_10435 [Alphaproteobacteria bacterium]